MMKTFEEYETWRTDDVICPHCAHVHGDSWEFPDNAIVDCHDCDKPFMMERNIDISYSTSKDL